MPETRQGTLPPRSGAPASRPHETPTERRAQDRLIRLRFPRPIALAWARAVTTDEATKRMRRLTAVTETTARLLAAFALADILSYGPLPAALRRHEKPLNRPPDGVWHDFAHRTALEAARLAGEADALPFIPELAEWWRETAGETTRERALNDAIRMRNVFAHGVSPDGPTTDARCEELESLLRETLSSLAWLAGYRIARVESARPDTSGLFSGTVSLYVGSDDVPWAATGSWGGWLPEGELYLLSPDGARALPLSPWLAVAPTQPGGQEQLLLWKQLGKNGGVGLGDGRTDGTCWHNSPPLSANKQSRKWNTLLHSEDNEIRARFARIDVAPLGHSLAVDGEPDEHIASLRARYEIGPPIGYGGMAVVYGARDTQLHEGVAIKVLRESLADDETTTERFRRESRILHRMRHPNVVPLLNVGALDDGRPFLVTRLAARGSLHERVADAASPSQVIDWMNQALAGLDAIHAEGVVHRDIKPSNLLVDETGRVMVADFGIAVADDGLELTKTLERIGSQAYMAPALLQGQPASRETDLYSLAVTAHELATGERPGPRGPGVGAPDAVTRWIDALLSGQREDAPDPAQSAPADESTPMAGRVDADPADARSERLPTKASWRPWLVAAALALVAGAAAAALDTGGRSESATDAAAEGNALAAAITPIADEDPAQQVADAMRAYREFRSAQQELQRRLLDHEIADDDLAPLAEFWGEGCYPCWWRSGDKSVSWVFRHVYNRNRRNRTDIVVDHLEHITTNEHGVWLLSEDRTLDERAAPRPWRTHQRVVRMVRGESGYVLRGETLLQYIDRWRARFGLSTEFLASVYESQGVCHSYVDTVTGQEWLIPEQPYWEAGEVQRLLEQLQEPQASFDARGEFPHNCAADGSFGWRLPHPEEIRTFVDNRVRANPGLRPIDHAWAFGSAQWSAVDLANPASVSSTPERRNRLWLVRFCPLGLELDELSGSCVEGE